MIYAGSERPVSFKNTDLYYLMTQLALIGSSKFEYMLGPHGSTEAPVVRRTLYEKRAGLLVFGSLPGNADGCGADP